MSETNPYMKRVAKRGVTGHGNVSEKKVGKSLGARLQPASGAMRSAKGDMKFKDTWLVEAKATTAASYRIEFGTLNKITSEALDIGRTPALTITFVTGEGSPRPRGKWVMIPEHLFVELVRDGKFSQECS